MTLSLGRNCMLTLPKQRQVKLSLRITLAQREDSCELFLSSLLPSTSTNRVSQAQVEMSENATLTLYEIASNS